MAAFDFPDTTGQATDGSFQYDAGGFTYAWNGEVWNIVNGGTGGGGGGGASVSVGVNPPIGAVEGDLWFNTNNGRLHIYYGPDPGASSQWVDVSILSASISGSGGGASIHIGENPPSNPSQGDLWWDSSEDSARLYVYYVDADSSQWVEASPGGGGGTEQFVPITGGTITGDLTVEGDATVGSLNGGPLSGFRNLVINGLMTVNQRDNGPVNLANTNVFTRDRWQTITSGSGNGANVNRSAVNLGELPNQDGAADALIYTTTAALAQGASSHIYLSQKIEGRDFRATSGWTKNATDRPVTLSFWVKSSVTGTYSFSLLRDPTGISVSNLLTYVGEYTVDTADTWEKKAITIPAPADAGASISSYVDLSFHVWAGSTRAVLTSGQWQDAASAVNVASSGYNANWGSASGQTFAITAIQLEPGPVATPFEHRPIGAELALCQRYCQRLQIRQSTSQSLWYSFPTTMRHAPVANNAAVATILNDVFGLTSAASGTLNVIFDAEL